MPRPKKYYRLPNGVTIEDLSLRPKYKDKPMDPWVLRYYAKALIPGTKRYLTRCFSTIKECETWACDKRAQLMAGTIPTTHCYINDYIDMYSDELKARRLSKTYRAQVDLIFPELIAAGAKDLNAPDFYNKAYSYLISRKAITELNGRKRRDSKTTLSPATINRYIAHLKSFCTWAHNNGFCHNNVAARMRKLKEPKRVKGVLSWAQLTELLSDAYRAEPYWLMVAVMAYTGARAGEAACLEVRNINYSEQTILIGIPPDNEDEDLINMRQKTKEERYVPLQPELADILKDVIKPHQRFVVADRYRNSRQTWRTDFDRMLLLANIEKKKGVSNHSLRHMYCAAMCTRVGIRATQLHLGHSDIKTTMGYANASEILRTSVIKYWPAGEDLYIRRRVPLV